MKIISWNCNGKFREKHKYITQEQADIYVIQEFENPELYTKEFNNTFSNYVWFGDNKNKGLAIFVKGDISLKNNSWPFYCLRNFISVKINNKYDLVGIWACSPYIEEYYVYQSINIDKYSENTILIGDFNSNAMWDKKHGKRNHSIVVSELEKINIVSAYHHFYKEEQGKESRATFYLYRHSDKPYHIDYCFANSHKMKNFEILNDNKWLKLSDHLPILVEME